MVDTQQLFPGQVEKMLTKRIKQAISQSSITSTRSGNKELSFLVKEILAAPFDSDAQVKAVGTALGQKIVALSKESNQQNLDAGVIRKLRFKQDWSAEFNIPEALPTETISKKVNKSAQTVVEPAKAGSPEKTADATGSEPEVEDTPAKTANLSAEEESETAENMPEDNTAAAATDASVVSEDEDETTMSTPNPDNVNNAVVAPEVAATSPESGEADALLADESDEMQTLSSEPDEVATSEESTAAAEAAESEVIEKVNSGVGTGATTAMPADPESVAAVNAEPTTQEKA
ncbi:hypothetical protein [Leptolyngbya sp. BC1307]|uniref:hypothetical protein n=1 Tax=Leptolyngbya sp. BC1307 TaxID=2029589 RepID=UPI000EFAF8D4|nr:hypothetical protein [Leptolyngbya sp. BC1307]